MKSFLCLPLRVLRSVFLAGNLLLLEGRTSEPERSMIKPLRLGERIWKLVGEVENNVYLQLY